jgi:hypothetical protein
MYLEQLSDLLVIRHMAGPQVRDSTTEMAGYECGLDVI